MILTLNEEQANLSAFHRFRMLTALSPKVLRQGRDGEQAEEPGMRCVVCGDLIHNEEQEDEDIWRWAGGVCRRYGTCLGASEAWWVWGWCAVRARTLAADFWTYWRLSGALLETPGGILLQSSRQKVIKAWLRGLAIWSKWDRWSESGDLLWDYSSLFSRV